MTRREITPKNLAAELTKQERLQIWLESFQICIQKRDYGSAEKLFHLGVISFGLEPRVSHGLSNLRKEWESTWPSFLAFNFDIKRASIIPHSALFMVAVEFHAAGLIHGSDQKNGRATIIIGDFDGKLLCLHIHLSESPND